MSAEDEGRRLRTEDEGRGLPALRRQAEVRWRAIAHGRVGMRDAQPQFWLWTIIGFMFFGVGYWYWAEHELEKQKSGVMAMQRAHSVHIGSKLFPIRDKVELWVQELAQAKSVPTLIDAELDLARLARTKGLYLRLEASNATTTEAIRKAAHHSLHDGFTSCLFHRKDKYATQTAPECLNPSDCPAGELCNESNVCAPPGQPFNLRLMYRALRILSPEWTDQLHQAVNDFQVRVFEHDLEKVARTDIPIAVSLMTSARYFTVLLDELPSSGLPAVEGLVTPDGRALESYATQLQTIPHFIRLGIWNLRSGKQVVALRTKIDATFVPVGRMASVSREARRAQQRQVNNCAVAEALRDEVWERDSAAGVKASAEKAAAEGANLATKEPEAKP